MAAAASLEKNRMFYEALKIHEIAGFLEFPEGNHDYKGGQGLAK